MQIYRCVYTLVFSLIVFTTISSCQGIKKRKQFPNSEKFDFASPKILDLPAELDEISGITYYAADTSVFAEIDEGGVLYKISLNNPTNVKKWKFDKKRDFEDIVLIDSTFYLLVSNGDIEVVNFKGDSIYQFKSDFSDLKKNKREFETLYKHPDTSLLIMICKECEEDKKKTLSSFSYAYNKDSVGIYAPYKVFDMDKALDDLGINKHFKPSCGTIDPQTGQLYLISAIQHALAIFDKNGKFEKLYDLDPAIYKQPEGICFTPEGHLIIANEFAESGTGTLLLLKNKKIKNNK